MTDLLIPPYEIMQFRYTKLMASVLSEGKTWYFILEKKQNMTGRT